MGIGLKKKREIAPAKYANGQTIKSTYGEGRIGSHRRSRHGKGNTWMYQVSIPCVHYVYERDDDGNSMPRTTLRMEPRFVPEWQIDKWQR